MLLDVQYTSERNQADKLTLPLPFMEEKLKEAEAKCQWFTSVISAT
jgi:hypothetical protein